MKFWKTLRDIMGQETNTKITQVFHYGCDILCREEEAADLINCFFASVGERVADCMGFEPPLQLDSHVETAMEEFPLMNINTFMDIVSESNVDKPSGISEINTKIMLDAMKAVPLLFTKLCNCSLITGKFPTSCKTAKISIIPKKGDTRKLHN